MLSVLFMDTSMARGSSIPAQDPPADLTGT
jgi:hypothetical protein